MGKYYSFDLNDTLVIPASGSWASSFVFQVPIFGLTALKYFDICACRVLGPTAYYEAPGAYVKVGFFNGNPPLVGAPVLTTPGNVVFNGLTLTADKWKAWRGNVDISAMNRIAINVELWGLTPGASDVYCTVNLEWGASNPFE